MTEEVRPSIDVELPEVSMIILFCQNELEDRFSLNAKVASKSWTLLGSQKKDDWQENVMNLASLL